MIESKRMDERRLAHAERLLEGLTPGRWQAWAGTGWPPVMVKLFGLDVPEEELGVLWPIAPEGTGGEATNYEGVYHIFCRESRDQDFVAHAPEVVRALLAHIKAQDAEIAMLRHDVPWPTTVDPTIDYRETTHSTRDIPYGTTTRFGHPDLLLVRSSPHPSLLEAVGLTSAHCAHLVPLARGCDECDAAGIPRGYRVAGPGCPGFRGSRAQAVITTPDDSGEIAPRAPSIWSLVVRLFQRG